MEITEIIVKTEYLRRSGELIAFVRVKKRTNASASLCGAEYADMRNSREPFDFRTHVFRFPEALLEREGGFLLTLENRAKKATEFFTKEKEKVTFRVSFDPSAIVPLSEAVSRTDRGLKLTSGYGTSGGYPPLCVLSYRRILNMVGGGGNIGS